MSSNAILLVNQGHSCNLGDIAINEAIGTVLNTELGYETVSVPFDGRVGSLTRVPKLNYLLACVLGRIPLLCDLVMRRRIRKILEEVEFDRALIGGGELLSGSYAPFASAFRIWVKELMRRGVPVGVVGVSGDIPKRGSMFRRYKKALRGCKYVGVRDLQTLRYVKDCYRIPNCHYAPDVVFSYKTSLDDFVGSSNKSDNRSALMCVPAALTQDGLRYLNIENNEEYFAYITKLLDNLLAQKSADKVIFSSTTKADYGIVGTLSRWYQSHTAVSGLAVEVLPYTDLISFVKTLANVSVVVSCRMHACILGLITGCSFRVVPWKEKIEVFDKEYSGSFSADSVSARSRAGIIAAIEAITTESVSQLRRG